MSSELSSNSHLFQPIQVGNVQLAHRVIMAPMTRFRAKGNYIPSDLTVEYYAQRASVPGTLLVTEGTYIAERAGGYGPTVPGIWNAEQINAWKKVTAAVHAKGSYIFCQLWALGRGAYPSLLEQLGLPYVAPSAIAHPDQTRAPRALSVEEIGEYTALYAQAARNAVAAGFDGVEVHGANGYLVDQFLQDVTNQRTDEYGGSAENRSRFAIEALAAITQAIGETKAAIRLSPWELSNGMGMADPIPTFTHLVSRIKALFPALAYLHVTEPRVLGPADRAAVPAGQSTDFVHAAWQPKLLVVAGGFDRALALQAAARGNVLVAFTRYFVANPDLPRRLRDGLVFNKYNRDTFYTPGAKGYIDYPFAEAEGAVMGA